MQKNGNKCKLYNIEKRPPFLIIVFITLIGVKEES